MKEMIKEHLSQYQSQAVLIQGAIQALQNLLNELEKEEVDSEWGGPAHG